MKKCFISLLFVGLILLMQCSEPSDGIRIPDKPFETLSEYGFFIRSLKELNPAEGVLPYDLNSPLFSDYAHKARFVWMPEGTSAQYTTDHALDFPTGAVLIKNFYYNHDEQNLGAGKKIIETRLLFNRGDEWEALSYIWNNEQTDAEYSIIGDIQEVAWTNGQGDNQKVNYIIPNKNQCKGCHSYDGKQKPIGPKVRNLNKDYTYSDGTMNQLDKWAVVGYLEGYDAQETHPSVAVWDKPDEHDLHNRAMAYLDINCGHCHNAKGAGSTSGLTLLADEELGLPLGIYKPTVSAGAGTGGHTYSIVPGSPETSIMVYRMKSNNPGAMMPELGRRLVHDEGVALIADWIANMEVDENLIPKNSGLN